MSVVHKAVPAGTIMSKSKNNLVLTKIVSSRRRHHYLNELAYLKLNFYSEMNKLNLVCHFRARTETQTRVTPTDPVLYHNDRHDPTKLKATTTLHSLLDKKTSWYLYLILYKVYLQYTSSAPNKRNSSIIRKLRIGILSETN